MKKKRPPLDAGKMRQRALISARAMSIKDNYIGYSADDIAQEVVLAFLLNPNDHGTVDQRTIDKIREHIGDLREPKSAELRRRIERTYLDAGFLKDLKAKDTENNMDFLSLLKSLDRIERAILVLFHQWGFKLEEIGVVFGLTDGRVAQIMVAALKKLRKRLKAEKL